MKWLFDHWEIKMISLILAIVIYAFTGAAITIRERVMVTFEPEMVAGLTADRQVLGFDPALVELELSGPSDVLANAESN